MSSSGLKWNYPSSYHVITEVLQSEEKTSNIKNEELPPTSPIPILLEDHSSNNNNIVLDKQENRSLNLIWRWFVMFSHLVILLSASTLWFMNLSSSGKWSSIDRRWSVSNLQFIEYHKNSSENIRYPKMIINKQIDTKGYYYYKHHVVVGDEKTSSISWPRINQENRLIYDYSIWGISSDNPEKENENRAVFLAEVDVAVINLLVLWVSTSYYIFMIPRNVDHFYTNLWKRDWVVASLILWNGFGMISVYFIRAFIEITPGTTIICSAGILWTMSIHLFWDWVGKCTTTIIPDHINNILSMEKENQNQTKHLDTSLYWMKFVRLNEAAFTVPLLMICSMCCIRDQHYTQNLQYIFGFTTAGLSLLIPMDAVGVMMREQVAYIIKFAFIRIEKNDMIFVDRKNLVDETVNLSLRLMLASIIMTSWGCFLYYKSVSEIFESNSSWDSRLYSAIMIAPVYAIFILSLEAFRNLFSFFHYYYPKKKTSDDFKLFVSRQGIISAYHTAAWDLGSIFFKSYISFILCTRAYDEWIKA